MVPRLILLISSGSEKKEPRYACLSEAKASHSHEYGPRFPPLLHTSYTMDCLTALVGEDVFPGYYAQ
jgi:hypothetical protein